jgi:hypothetical protein
VIATPPGSGPTVMSVGCLVLVFTSIVDTVAVPMLVTYSRAVVVRRGRLSTDANR